MTNYDFDVRGKKLCRHIRVPETAFVEGDVRANRCRFLFSREWGETYVSDCDFFLYAGREGETVKKERLSAGWDGEGLWTQWLAGEENQLLEGSVDIQLEVSGENFLWRSEVLSLGVGTALAENDGEGTDPGNPGDFYTKEEVDDLLGGLEERLDLSRFYTKEQVYKKEEVGDLLEEISQAMDEKADKASVYTKEETYTREEVKDLLGNGESGNGYSKEETDTLLENYCLKQTFQEQIEELEEAVGEAREDAQDALTQADAISTSLAEEYYSSTQTDLLLLGKMGRDEAYTKEESVEFVEEAIGDLELDQYARREETYTKEEVEELVSGSGGGGYALTDGDGGPKEVFTTEDKINDAVNTGIYLCEGAQDAPGAISGVLYVIAGGNRVFQTYYDFIGGIYYRYSASQMWTGWKAMAFS